MAHLVQTSNGSINLDAIEYGEVSYTATSATSNTSMTSPAITCTLPNGSFLAFRRYSNEAPVYKDGAEIFYGTKYLNNVKIGAGYTSAAKTDVRVYLYFVAGENDPYVGENDFVPSYNVQGDSGGYTFNGCVLGEFALSDLETRSWDESISEDPENDPFNEEPIGGEYADTMPITDTFLQTLDAFPNPERDMNMNYGGTLVTYVLDSSHLSSLGSALFEAGFWTNLKNKFEGLSDPLSMITNAIQIPFNPGGSGRTFKIGGVQVEDGSSDPISIPATTTRYIKDTMGSVHLKEIWGSAKDYSDCSVQIYLPYVGIKELDPDIVIGNICTLVVYVDIWTGDLLYLLHVSNASNAKKYFNAQSVPYRWAGNCGKRVPIGKVDNTNQILGLAATIGAIGAGIATMGVGAAGVVGGMGLAGAGAAGAASAGMASGLTTMEIGAGITGAAAVKALRSEFKPSVQSSSGVQGASGQMDFQYAYIMVKRGVPKYPNGWRSYMGAPNYQMFQGNSLSGYVQFAEIHLTGMADASEDERAALERLLTTEGVIL